MKFTEKRFLLFDVSLAHALLFKLLVWSSILFHFILVQFRSSNLRRRSGYRNSIFEVLSKWISQLGYRADNLIATSTFCNTTSLSNLFNSSSSSFILFSSLKYSWTLRHRIGSSKWSRFRIVSFENLRKSISQNPKSSVNSHVHSCSCLPLAPGSL